MTVAEFTKLDAAGTMFAIVDATKTGYMHHEHIEIEAGKDVVRQMFGDKEVVGYEIKTKRAMYLYVK